METVSRLSRVSRFTLRQSDLNLSVRSVVRKTPGRISVRKMSMAGLLFFSNAKRRFAFELLALIARGLGRAWSARGLAKLRLAGVFAGAKLRQKHWISRGSGLEAIAAGGYILIIWSIPQVRAEMNE